MRWLTILAASAAAFSQASAKAVFAHFMVGNTENYTTSDWQDDMLQAKKAHIDAFALNMAHGDPVNEKALPAAFSAAANAGLQLFFSFDYAGNGSWPPETVTKYINDYASSGTYFRYEGKPFVSTFEGPDNATDWIGIKQQTSCFFMPDWSSLGAKKAMAAAGGVADGLFSWAAWAYGDWDMYTYNDASYAQYLGGKPYMMPISPWFYTNLPGYEKNWLWRGDRAWGDRWFQAQWWQPEFVEIISWNDYGESHYIGPVRDHAMGAFDVGRAPYNYGKLPHDSWRDILPFAIDMYKNNVARFDFDRAIAWYTLVQPSACNSNGTMGNTPSQLQMEYFPEDTQDHKIHFMALLGHQPDKVTCNVGGQVSAGKVYQGPENNGAGMYLGECDILGTGSVQVTITKGGMVLVLDGDAVSADCARWDGFTNFNAYVMGSMSPASVGGQAADISQLVCVNGTGMHTVKTLCEFTCSLGYCPQGACVCTRLGKPPTLPKAKDVDGYPLAAYDESISGLCSFACNYGTCSDFASTCSTTKVPLPVWPASIFEPPFCTAGTGAPGSHDYDDLCQFTCAHGFCPMRLCSCTKQGFLNLLDPNTTSRASPLPGINDHGLCRFACQRGYCPSALCFENGVFDLSGYGDDYDPYEDEYTDMELIPDLNCDPDQAPQTLDDLVNAVTTSSIPPYCWSKWALSILLDTLLSLKDQYAESTEGYDELFDVYQDYVRKSVGPQLLTFAAPEDSKSPGLKYFDCVLTMGNKASAKMGCQYLSLQSYDRVAYTVEYSLRDSAGFYGEALDKLGIEQSWITFGQVVSSSECADFGDTPAGLHTEKPCRKLKHTLTNFPVAVDRNLIEVPNPKVVMEAALPNMTALADSLVEAFFMLATDSNDAEDGDIVVAASMPIFMLQQAVDSMNEIKKLAVKIIEEDRKRLILLILNIVLMVLPIIGEAGGVLFGGVAAIGRIAALVDIVGNAGLTAYDIIEDPQSAPFAIMGLLMGFGAGRRSDESAFGEAGKARRGISGSDIAKLGDGFAQNDRKIQTVVNACVR